MYMVDENPKSEIDLEIEDGNDVTKGSEPGGASGKPSRTQCTVTLSVDPSVGGTVTGSGTYSSGATVTLTATANTGYTFIGWFNNNTNNNTVISSSKAKAISYSSTYTFTISKDVSLIAKFKSSENVVRVITPENSVQLITVNIIVPTQDSEKFTMNNITFNNKTISNYKFNEAKNIGRTTTRLSYSFTYNFGENCANLEEIAFDFDYYFSNSHLGMHSVVQTASVSSNEL